MTTKMLGYNRVNPNEYFSAKVAVTSEIIAKSKGMYFIELCAKFHFYKLYRLGYSLLV